MEPGMGSEDAPAPLKIPYQDVLVGDLLGATEEHDIEPLIHSGAGQRIGYFDEGKYREGHYR